MLQMHRIYFNWFHVFFVIINGNKLNETNNLFYLIALSGKKIEDKISNYYQNNNCCSNHNLKFFWNQFFIVINLWYSSLSTKTDPFISWAKMHKRMRKDFWIVRRWHSYGYMFPSDTWRIESERERAVLKLIHTNFYFLFMKL